VERYAQLNALKFIDEIVPYQSEQDVIDILQLFDLDIRFLGEEYKENDFTGKDICRKRGIQLHFNKRDHRFSSSDLRKRVAERENSG
jgi:glycerol-3-phosphate cytidylyltransferase